ncbi:ATP-dependent zinc protease [uncultured Halomonas sp.]|uniref:ATP-dependent zinc protease family protein n=1 Tax=uncultured Halomonas sp. TaxID=173971 RepID=UPI002639640B|nr:ATP-dependent zinc protease [uncultured Halomonas sp.]
MSRPLLYSGVLSLSLLLAGCALPIDSTDSHPVLGADEFTLRMDQLEADLAARCELQQVALSDHSRRQEVLVADVREVGSLLRHLRADVERLERVESEPLVITQECVADELGLANKEVVGRSEWIGLPDVGTYLKARIDSGANTSSLSAQDITRFERDGANWVRFRLGLTQDDVVVDDVREEWIEAPVERRVRIVQASGEESRPVVSLMMTLGPIRESVEFTLNDRTHLNYPVLLGRRFLMDIAVIDVAETYLHERPEFPGGRPADEAAMDEDDRDDEER